MSDPSEIERRNALLDDLQRLADGWRPAAADLAAALVLEGWYICLYPGSDRLAMCGFVADHPRLGRGIITTSPIMAADFSGGWVRTCSRFYRIGDPGRSGLAPDALS